MRILITGGAGFVGSRLALSLKEDTPAAQIVVLDNLKRRGSELNLASFKHHGISFVHGDVRNQKDLEALNDDFDLFIEASAEPSVLAGVNSSPQYLLETNLLGTVNCLEFARRHAPNFIFLSTSRVYSLRPLKEINLQETPSRFEIARTQNGVGVSEQGIGEDFPVLLPRSLYGATKLASELLIQEYADTYSLRAIINRCGVIAGAGQFGKTDQGVFTLWVAHHFFRKALKYTGFGGKGKQVRDLLHPHDLYQILKAQVNKLGTYSGEVFNVGGGTAVSTSLLELTAICQEITGNSVAIEEEPRTFTVDVPLYISDHAKVSSAFDWQPHQSVTDIVKDTFTWLKTNETALSAVFE